MVLFLLICHRSERSEVKRSRESLNTSLRGVRWRTANVRRGNPVPAAPA
ncbi:MAG: hypothetical protein NC218_06430 [Acetobacter sp.]|nr:hypothetical protein [Acetobacter sp.]